MLAGGGADEEARELGALVLDLELAAGEERVLLQGDAAAKAQAIRGVGRGLDVQALGAQAGEDAAAGGALDAQIEGGGLGEGRGEGGQLVRGDGVAEGGGQPVGPVPGGRGRQRLGRGRGSAPRRATSDRAAPRRSRAARARASGASDPARWARVRRWRRAVKTTSAMKARSWLPSWRRPRKYPVRTRSAGPVAASTWPRASTAAAKRADGRGQRWARRRGL
ncbi:MAG: hypothetical protein R3F60_32055 [bacterium]